jgi:hypothetical protein
MAKTKKPGSHMATAVLIPKLLLERHANSIITIISDMPVYNTTLWWQLTCRCKTNSGIGL